MREWLFRQAPTIDADRQNRAQQEYGALRGVPWGISESGYNTVDAYANYQYRAFGVPDLGLKRGLGDDLLIRATAATAAPNTTTTASPTEQNEEGH